MRYTFLALWIFISCSLQAIEINLTEVGFYNPDYVSITKVGDNYLLSAAKPDPAVRIVDKSSTVLAEYTKAGPGPDELNSQKIMAVSSSKIYVFTRSPAILVFDHQLNLLPESKNFNMFANVRDLVKPIGLMTSETELTIINNARLDHGALLFNINDAVKKPRWEPYDRQIPKDHLPTRRGFPPVTFGHNNYVFLLREYIFPERDEYDVIAHRMINGTWQPMAELSYKVEDLIPVMEGVACFISYVFKMKQGYVVVVVSGIKGKKAPEHYQTNLDYFDEKGRFQRRASRENLYLKSVINGPEVFEVVERDEGDFLVSYQF